MALPPEQRVKFFVFVIESPSAVDVYHRRNEGDVIKSAVSLNEINCIVKMAISPQAFEAALKIGLSEAMSKFPGFVPVLHISAHGNTQGIQLSNEKIITWTELSELLIPINKALNGSLVVCLSSCEGYAGVRMAMQLPEEHPPYFVLVGCTGKPTWSEAAVAYATFYHQLHRGEYINTAVEAMNVASGSHNFVVEHAENTRQTFQQYFLSQVNTQSAVEELEENLAQEGEAHASDLKKLV